MFVGKRAKQGDSIGEPCVSIDNKVALSMTSECSIPDRDIAKDSRRRAISVLKDYRSKFHHVTVTVDHGSLREEELRRWYEFYGTPGRKILCVDERCGGSVATACNGGYSNAVDDPLYEGHQSRQRPGYQP
jgi:hypothetical protein